MQLDLGVAPAETIVAAGEADGLRRESRALARAPQKAFWEIGEALYRLSLDPRHTNRWGFRSWTHWAEVELGLSARVASYYRQAFEWFQVTEKVPPAFECRLRRLPWTKVRVLVHRALADDVETWLPQAERLSRRDLALALRTAKEPTAQRVAENLQERMVTLQFRVFEDSDARDSQAAMIALALDRAGEMAKSRNRGHLLSLICQDFLATTERGGDLGQRARLFERLNRVLLVAADPESHRVVFGMDRLVRIAEAHLGADSDAGGSAVGRCPPTSAS